MVLLLAACGGGGGGNEGGAPPQVARFAYVANQSSGSAAGGGELSGFTVNASTGLLRHNGYAAVSSGGGLTAVAADPLNRFVYATNASGVWGFKIDGTTGTLSGITGPFNDGSVSPVSIALDPSGQFVYVASSSGVSGYKITDATTGALTAVPPASPLLAGTGPTSVVVDTSGRYVYVASSSGVTPFKIQSGGTLSGLSGALPAGTSPAAVGVHPSGKYVYVANSGSANVSGYSINGDGTLTGFTSQPATVGTGPRSIAFDAAGKFVFVSNQTSGEVSVLSVDAFGAISPVNASGNVGSFAVAVDPTGQFAYSVNKASGDITMFSITSNGALGPNGSIAGRFSPGAMAIARGSSSVTYTPRFAYTANFDSNDVSVFRIDAGSGALSAVGSPVPTNVVGAFSIAADPAGRFLYVGHETDSKVVAFKIDANGVPATSGSPIAAGTAPDAITVEPSGRFVYTANVTSGDVSAFSIDQTSGALSGGAKVLTGGTEPFSVAADPSGRFLYAVNHGSASVSALKIDALTGAVQTIGTPVALTGVTFPIAAVVNPNGKFVYVVSRNTPGTNGNVTVLQINLGSGAVSEASGTGSFVVTDNGPRSIGIDAAGKAVYTANEDNSTVSFYTVGLTGLLAENTVAGSPKSITGALRPIALDISGRFVYFGRYVANNVAAFSIDPTTAILTSAGSTNTGNGLNTGLSPFGITTTGTIQ
jgi:6-phosphogluconolactonase (cycloisomerase 2 family)